MSEPEDADLMARAAQGDEASFSILVTRYGDVLLNFFLRKGVSYSDGQDLAQRTFLRLWRYRTRYSSRQAKFTTFLFLLAGQETIDFFRSERRRRALADGVSAQAELEAADALKGAAQDKAEDEGAAVRRAVSGLAPGMRDVVELGVFQDLPYAEVARILGIPEGTVKSRMFHALRKLKELLHES